MSEPGLVIAGVEVKNDNLILPRDLLLPLGLTLVWAALHSSLRAWVFKPLANWLIQLPLKPLGKGTKADSAIHLVADSSHLSSGELRNRKMSLEESVKEPLIAPSPEQQTYEKELKKAHQSRLKFVISAWKFTNFSITSALGLYLLVTESWFTTPVQYFAGYGSHPMSPLLKIFYQVGFASYGYATLSVFIEPRQKDFVFMVVHHIATLFLIHMSYLNGFFRIGSAILLCHEVSDPFMEVAKMFLYAGANKLADCFFALFAGVFIYTRNYIFPVYIISSIPLHACDENGRSLAGEDHVRYAAIVALCILEGLHIYWASLILKMVMEAIRSKGVQDDIRNEEEQEI